MLKLAIGLAAALWAGIASGADAPQFAPPAPWVKPVEIPKPSPQEDAAEAQLLLRDIQNRLGPDSEEAYSETAVRIQTPQGLADAGNIALAWRPDTDTLIIHKVHIIRDGRIIDILAGDKQKFTVLRRENNLERAMLDGTLTAAIQPEDLRLGDIFDVAFTIQRHDPVTLAHPELIVGNLLGGRIAHLHVRAIWPKSKPARWRKTDGLSEPKTSANPDGTELVFDMTDTQPVKPPKGAPPRFFQVGQLEVSTFPAWSDVSALLAPLFKRAAVLKPDSPLKAEIAKIKAASADPKVRAAAALRLVQDQIRYLFLGMGDGGYAPADADLTWSRRFGDCKAKTAILLALLHELDIEAEPAAVSTALGDGLDERLPLLGIFNHVLVRATIGGKVYWMDGTRTNDRGLDDLSIPPFKWALPLQASGATLEKLVVPPFDKPEVETSFRLDVSAGLDLPAIAHGERILRGDNATGFRLQLANVSAVEREASLRNFWSKQYDWLDVKQADASFDETTGEEHITMDGSAKLTWWQAPAQSERKYRMDRAAETWKPDFSRDPGRHRDAPFAVDYPDFGRTLETIILPRGGQGFSVEGGDIDKVIAGREFKRTIRIDKNIVTMEKSIRAIAPEFPATETLAVEKAATEMRNATVYVVAPSYYRETKQEANDHINSEPTTAEDYLNRAYSDDTHNKNHAQAIADLTKAIELDPNSSLALANRGIGYFEAGDSDLAMADFNKAIQLDPRQSVAYRGLGLIAARKAQYLDALIDFTRCLGIDPKDEFALIHRGNAYLQMKDSDKALADYDEVLRLHPERAEVYVLRGNLFLDLNKPEQALAEADKMIAMRPRAPKGHALRAKALHALGRDEEAAKEQTE